jgi:hypothetical protein
MMVGDVRAPELDPIGSALRRPARARLSYKFEDAFGLEPANPSDWRKPRARLFESHGPGHMRFAEGLVDGFFRLTVE